jgi:hypothetical protein
LQPLGLLKVVFFPPPLSVCVNAQSTVGRRMTLYFPVIHVFFHVLFHVMPAEAMARWYWSDGSWWTWWQGAWWRWATVASCWVQHVEEPEPITQDDVEESIAQPLKRMRLD